MEGTMGDDTFRRVCSIVANQFGIRQDKVALATSFIDDLEPCSLDEIELIMAFEDAFAITLPDNVAETIITVQDAVDYIERQRDLQRRDAPIQTA
jgi:acyl carrier protein